MKKISFLVSQMFLSIASVAQTVEQHTNVPMEQPEKTNILNIVFTGFVAVVFFIFIFYLIHRSTKENGFLNRNKRKIIRKKI